VKKYSVLLIGCGHIGMEHLLDIYYRDDINIYAVVDIDESLAKKAAARCNAQRWGTDYRKFIRDDNIDIIIIATFSSTHLTILKDCLAAGKHVLCEKPIAISEEDGREFVRVVKESKQKVLVAHVLRHNLSYKKIHELVSNGEIGELRMIRMTQNHHIMDWPRYYRLMENCTPTLDCGVHYYDIAQWIAGSRITEVNGFGVKTQDNAPNENYTLVSFEMENGCKGYYEVGWGESIRATNVKEFIGTKGYISLQMKMQRSIDFEEGDLITLYHSDTGVYESINVRATYKDMYSQIKTLIDMIENDTMGEPTIDDVWSAFVVAHAAEKSVKGNCKVIVDNNY